ncbi:FG-GAP-like repeat-containing protein [Streptomyces roseifaciens]|uniref:FG-GAP-like repeat-containing protein n=1 Tax=Streptomyces roseifaciens TaxID=1488406 RepID=UPI0013966A3C|nr:FG-GAP-like repeat-containing protein [Streptomyces roseifaciens]
MLTRTQRALTALLTAGVLTAGTHLAFAAPSTPPPAPVTATPPAPSSSPGPQAPDRPSVAAPAVTAVTRNWKVPRLAVMPLGDSITHGARSSNGSGYRADLWNQLAPHANKLDFVGSEHHGTAPDTDHEGHWGWRISGLVANVDQWLPTAAPNVVLLHIGTNDLHDDYRPDTAPRRLGNLIDKITSQAPDMTVLVSSLVPSTDGPTQKRIEQFNAAVPQLVAERRGKGRHVGYVDMSAVTTNDLADELHPKDNGYVKMADAFSQGIARAAEDGWIQQRVDVKPAPVRPAPPPGDYRVDIDGDGKADYLAVQDNGSVKAWINNGGTGHGSWIERGTFASGAGEPGRKIRFADINADGKADYLILQDDGSVKAWINNGGNGNGGWTDRGVFATGVGAPGSRVRFADINGDGRADYLVVGKYGVVEAWLNNGGTGQGSWIERGTFAGGTGEPEDRIRFADINGDGKADYLAVQDDSSVRAWINTGTDGHVGWSEFDGFASGVGETGSKVRFADINADGRADYLILQDDGVVQAWLNDIVDGRGSWTDRGVFATGVGEPGHKIRI